jgi:hypothetical protein
MTKIMMEKTYMNNSESQASQFQHNLLRILAVTSMYWHLANAKKTPPRLAKRSAAIRQFPLRDCERWVRLSCGSAR